jgi:hypothetical protein
MMNKSMFEPDFELPNQLKQKSISEILFAQ